MTKAYDEYLYNNEASLQMFVLSIAKKQLHHQNMNEEKFKF